MNTYRRTCALLLATLPLAHCGHHSSSGGGNGAAPNIPGATGAEIVTDLKYYNHFPFNNVYTTVINLGGQNLEMVMDTGSSNLLAIGDGQHCSNCQNEYGYTSVYSPGATSQALKSSWSVSFLPIGTAKIQGYQDQLSFAGHTVANNPFGLVTSEVGIPNIWGIAYQAAGHPRAAPQLPLFDALVSSASLANQFSMRLCALKTGSSMTLGGFDSGVSDKMAQVQWTPVAQRLAYSISVTRLYVNPVTTSGSGAASQASPWTWTLDAGDSIIVDSGTNPLVIPAANVATLVQLLKQVAVDNSISIPDSFWPTATDHGGYATLTDAEIAKFPAISMDIAARDPATGAASTVAGSKTFTLTIAPSTYFQTREDGQRFLGVESATSTNILGTVFMENYVVLFDRGSLDNTVVNDPTARVGFLPNSGLCK